MRNKNARTKTRTRKGVDKREKTTRYKGVTQPKHGEKMVTDKVLRVKTDGGNLDIIITGDQLVSTARRRIATLMPKARILDITEVLLDQQHDLAGTRKVKS